MKAIKVIVGLVVFFGGYYLFHFAIYMIWKAQTSDLSNSNLISIDSDSILIAFVIAILLCWWVTRSLKLKGVDKTKNPVS